MHLFTESRQQILELTVEFYLKPVHILGESKIYSALLLNAHIAAGQLYIVDYDRLLRVRGSEITLVMKLLKFEQTPGNVFVFRETLHIQTKSGMYRLKQNELDEVQFKFKGFFYSFCSVCICITNEYTIFEVCGY